MKIFQITHWGSLTNYGALLQAYALQRALRDMGHDVTLIRASFSLHNILRKWYKAPFRVLGALKKRRMELREEERHPRDFAGFTAQYMQSTPEIFHSFEQLKKFDFQAQAFVTGSDQVWSSKKIFPPYFLQFGPRKAIRFSYAASVGSKARFNEEYLHSLKKALSTFDAVSLREFEALEQCQKAGVENAVLVPDPVLLLEAEHYRKNFTVSRVIPEKPYILVYMVGNRSAIDLPGIAEKCLREGKELLAVCAQHDNTAKMAHPAVRAVYPTIPEFLTLVDHAEKMITDSFHGTVFSLLFNTPFLVYHKNDHDARFDTLDQLFEIADSCYALKKENTDGVPDFPKINEKIAALRQQGRAFLEKVFEGKGAGEKEGLKISAHACCGCGVCASVCPRGAVVMSPGKDGFLRPLVDEALCVRCGKCQQSCPENRENPVPENTRCFYAYADSAECVRTSSSGGIFTGLAQAVLASGGGVAGVMLDEKFNAVMKLSTQWDEIARMKQAKYVQAVIPSGFYGEVKAFLESGNELLLTGTPCQIAACKAFLGPQTYPNLLTAEVICHGVPSPAVWQSYLQHVSGTAGALRHVEFRNKSRGWHEYSLLFEGEKSTFLDGRHDSPYMKLFIGDVILRASCAACQFKAGRSGADLSLGDFWKLRKAAPDMDNDSGVSMVLTHSARGLEMLQKILCAVLKEFPFETIRQCNRAFFDSAVLHPLREKYFEKFTAGNGKWFDPCEFFKKRSRKKSFMERLKKLF